MNFLLFVSGVAVLGFYGPLMWLAWPRRGQLCPAIDNNTVGELYTFGVILSFAIGIALLLN